MGVYYMKESDFRTFAHDKNQMLNGNDLKENLGPLYKLQSYFLGMLSTTCQQQRKFQTSIWWQRK